MKCPLCSSRKGKRRCPALGQEICAVCCGEKRRIEIDCPESCAWLEQGQRHELARSWEDYARHQAPAKTRRWLAALQTLLPVLDAVEQALVDASALLHGLEPGELADALGGVRQGYASEAGGILWRPSSPSPRTELVQKTLVESLEGLREAVRKGGHGELPAAALAEALEVVADRVAFHRDRGDFEAFILTLRRARPVSSRREAPPSPGLIIPG